MRARGEKAARSGSEGKERGRSMLRPYKAKTEEAGLPTESGYIPAAATKTGLALKQNGRPEFKRDARFVFL